jgi:hypothetical protein
VRFSRSRADSARRIAVLRAHLRLLGQSIATSRPLRERSYLEVARIFPLRDESSRVPGAYFPSLPLSPVLPTPTDRTGNRVAISATREIDPRDPEKRRRPRHSCGADRLARNQRSSGHLRSLTMLIRYREPAFARDSKMDQQLASCCWPHTAYVYTYENWKRATDWYQTRDNDFRLSVLDTRTRVCV